MFSFLLFALLVKIHLATLTALEDCSGPSGTKSLIETDDELSTANIVLIIVYYKKYMGVRFFNA